MFTMRFVQIALLIAVFGMSLLLVGCPQSTTPDDPDQGGTGSDIIGSWTLESIEETTGAQGQSVKVDYENVYRFTEELGAGGIHTGRGTWSLEYSRYIRYLNFPYTTIDSSTQLPTYGVGHCTIEWSTTFTVHGTYTVGATVGSNTAIDMTITSVEPRNSATNIGPHPNEFVPGSIAIMAEGIMAAMNVSADACGDIYLANIGAMYPGVYAVVNDKLWLNSALVLPNTSGGGTLPTAPGPRPLDSASATPYVFVE